MSRRGRPNEPDGKRSGDPTAPTGAPVDDRTAEAAGRAVGPIEAAIDRAVHTHVEHPAAAAPFVPPPLPPLSAHVPTPPGLTPRPKPAGSSPPPMSFYRPATPAAAPTVVDHQSPVPPPDPSGPPARPPTVSSFSTEPKPTVTDSHAMRPRITGTTDVPRLSEAPAAQPATPVIPTQPPPPPPAHQRAQAPSEPPKLPDPPKFQPAAPEPEPPKPPPAPAEPLLFEVAWEVCWQLGGIYTVLRTKAPAMLQRWGERYCLIGPYNPATAAYEFDEQPAEGIYRDAIDGLAQAGIPAKFGRWLIPGRPKTILIDYRARYSSLGADKYALYKDHGISTPPDDGEVNEVTAFGFATAEFFARLSNVAGNRPILAHFHEWMAGVAIPRIAHLRLPIATVFTTHATLLGRYLAGDMANFYDQLPHINADEMAAKYQIYARFAIERAATHACTVFTTVSEVTDAEAQQLLGRKADAIVPNGLNIQRFAALHEFQNLHQTYKERIHEFVMGHFFPSYTFDLDKTLYFVTSGRYEYRNKGFDLFIEAMYRLNQRLKNVPDRPNVVAFIVTRAPTKHINVQTLQRQSMFET